MENNDINETSSQTPEESVAEFTADDNYVAKHVEVQSYHSSYKEEYQRNDELIPVPVYESLLQNLEKSSMLCRNCDTKFERMDLYTRHINFCRKRLYEKNYGNDNKFAKKNTISSTSIVTEKKLTLHSHSNITTIKQEPIELNLGNGLPAENIKQEPIDLDLDNVLTADNKRNIKLEPQLNASPIVFNGDFTETNNFKGEQSNSVNEFQQNERIEYLNLPNTRNAVIKEEPTTEQQCKFAIKSTIDSTSIVTDRKLRSHSNIITIKPEPIELDIGNGLTADNNKQEPTSKHQCNVCQKQFVNANNLTKHMHIHTALQMPHRCQLCFRAFKNRGHLTNHMKGFQCPVKKEQLSTINDESPVILVNTRATNVQTKKKKLAAPNTIQISKPFICKICNMSFTSRKGVKNHLKSHYWNKNTYQRDETGNKNDTKKHCNQCEKKFSEINALQAHIKAQHPPVEYKCDDCGEQFPINFYLGVHIIKIHK